MLRQIIFLVSLLMSYVYISLGQGAISAVLLASGAEYGFSDAFLGSLFSVMYFGFLVGNFGLRYLLPRISYIRTFIVSAAVLAVCVLLFPLLPYEYAWIVLRFIYGLFFFIIVVLTDTWLNSVATTENRSRLLGAVWTFNFIAYGLSQYILLLGEKNILFGFMVVAVFITLAVIPVGVTRVPEPALTQESTALNLSFLDAYKIAPISMMGQFVFGLITGASWLFIRYAENITDSIEQTSQLAVLFFGSGFLLQYIIGVISDKVKDRRTVMMVVYLISAISAVGLFFGNLMSYGVALVVAVIFSSVSATLYALHNAYGQDFVDKDSRAAYSARLFQTYSVGAVIGPLAAGALMDYLSSAWLFALISAVLAVMFVLAITDRIWPRYLPIKSEEYQMSGMYSAAVVTEQEVYSTSDIGPDIPEDAAAAADAPEDAEPSPDAQYGPDIPESDAATADASAPEEADTADYGPSLPVRDGDKA